MAPWILAVLSTLLLACGGGGAVPRSAEASAGGGTAVRRGDLSTRLLLSGELEAEAGAVIGVPRTPSWRVQVRWMAEDGTSVEPGDLVVELDNSAFVTELEDKRLKAAETASRLAQRRADLSGAEAEAVLAVERARVGAEKAGLEAAVPEDLLSRREVEERRLALRRAELDLAQAEADLAAQRAQGEAETAQLDIQLAVERRAVAVAEAAIAALSLRAPVAGTLVLGRHPWEDRKVREGDNVWVGLALARIPDLARSSVAARLPDVDHGRLALGDRARCTLDAFPDRPFAGRVTAISPIAREEAGDSLRRFFAVTLVPEGEGFDPERMRPGMSVKVERLEEPRRGVLLAPRAALDLASRPPRARLAAGKAVVVELGACSAQECEVLAGLAEGDLLAAGEAGP